MLRLRDGRLLLPLSARVALYDPRPGTWAFSAGSLPTIYLDTSRSVVLQDGRVLMGLGGSWEPTTNTVVQSTIVNTDDPLPDLYDPYGGSAVLLADGRVLFSGGRDYPARGALGLQTVPAKYVFDPRTNTWTGSPSGGFGFAGHASVRLADGRVLTVGGLYYTRCGDPPLGPDTALFTTNSTSAAALYDPNTGNFTDAAPMREGRSAPSAILLPNGKVLVVGAERIEGTCSPSMTARDAVPVVRTVRNQFAAEIYDPQTNSWKAAGTALESGRLLGLASGNVFLASVEPALFEPSTERWFAVPEYLDSPRVMPSAGLFDGDRVLVAGGTLPTDMTRWSTAEIYTGGHLGTPCTTSADCSMGQCVDGVCCDRACTGPCEACSSAKKGAGTPNGRCGLILEGNDPDNECVQWGCERCQTSGACNGKGACDDRTGTFCGGEARCTNSGRSLVMDTCNAAGACESAVVQDCGPGRCSALGRGCNYSCDDFNICPSDALCSEGQCVGKGMIANGKYCWGDATWCASNYCVAGECEEPCNEKCRACEALGPDAASPFVQRTKLIPSEQADQVGEAQFGFTTAISEDFAVVGTWFGHVYVYTRNGARWTEQQKLTLPSPYHFDMQVAASGTTIVVGRPAEGVVDPYDSRGAVHIFVRSGSSWVEQQRLTPPEMPMYGEFGAEVSIAGDTLLVGTGRSFGSGTGAVHVFTRTGTTWTEQQKLKPSDSEPQDGFGRAVSISGDTVLIGAPNDTVGANTNQGSAYVFTRTGSTWTEQQKLTSGEATPQLAFGTSVALSGETALVGEMKAAAHVFVRSGSTWTKQQKLSAGANPESDLNRVFGTSLALSGDIAIVGTAWDKVGTNAEHGSAFVFGRSGATWRELQKLTPCDGRAGSAYGGSVGFSGDTAIVGTKTYMGGAAYLYKLRTGERLNGVACSAASDCSSGYCSDGRCCNAACDGACDACSVATGASADGVCTPLAAGSAGSPLCEPLACNGKSGACTKCTVNADCPAGKLCSSDHKCVPAPVRLCVQSGCDGGASCADAAPDGTLPDAAPDSTLPDAAPDSTLPDAAPDGADPPEAGPDSDSLPDAGPDDGSPPDAPLDDAGTSDALLDRGIMHDAELDSGTPADAQIDSGSDGAPRDSGASDSGTTGGDDDASGCGATCSVGRPRHSPSPALLLLCAALALGLARRKARS